ncbi:MAG: helical backbone metal receptor [Anaerolineae bacterium]
MTSLPEAHEMDSRTYQHQMDSPVAEPPRRVVSLVPSMTESLFELNVGDRLIAVTDYCIYPADQVARLPRIGGTKNPDVQRIIEMHPDLVLANHEENRKEDIEALQAAGIPVWVTFPRTMREAFNVLWNIMHLFDEPGLVERVRAMEWTLDWLERMAENRESPLKVFVPIWNDPLMTFNAETYAHDLIRVCGGTNVFAAGETRYPHVTLEEVEAAQPDLILLPSEPFADHAALFRGLAVPAAQNGRILTVDGSLLFWHGTRMARAMNMLPAMFYPIMDEGSSG